MHQICYVLKFSRQYPTVEVGRPSRVYDTISRLVGPTRPSLRGPAKLTGSPLASYRKRIWLPRIRNTNAGKMTTIAHIKYFAHSL